ncbi:MAG: hypothetical protein HQM10_09325 [Candidatus Riflebacteria bacterium]|nr:hypothetical protein [Candidatus Riflebacteria bacterium]
MKKLGIFLMYISLSVSLYAAQPLLPWGSVNIGSCLTEGELKEVNGVNQPKLAGWFFCSVALGQAYGAEIPLSHAAIAHYDGNSWTYSTQIGGGQSVPAPQADLATCKTWYFYKLEISSGMGKPLLTDAEFQSLLERLASNYARYNIPYSVYCETSPDVDGTCNTYAAFLLAFLGNTASWPVGHVGARNISRAPKSGGGPDSIWIYPMSTSPLYPVELIVE